MCQVACQMTPHLLKTDCACMWAHCSLLLLVCHRLEHELATLTGTTCHCAGQGSAAGRALQQTAFADADAAAFASGSSAAAQVSCSATCLGHLVLRRHSVVTYYICHSPA